MNCSIHEHAIFYKKLNNAFFKLEKIHYLLNKAQHCLAAFNYA
jgi:hypothetical protein